MWSSVWHTWTQSAGVLVVVKVPLYSEMPWNCFAGVFSSKALPAHISNLREPEPGSLYLAQSNSAINWQTCGQQGESLGRDTRMGGSPTLQQPWPLKKTCSTTKTIHHSSVGFGLLQREVAGRLHAEVAALQERARAESAGWAERCDGLRQSLAAQEAHSAALEAQLASRPTAHQVSARSSAESPLPRTSQ